MTKPTAMTLGEILNAAIEADPKTMDDGDRLAVVLRSQGWVLLPFEPSIADLHVIAKHLPTAGSTRIFAKEIYAALVERRKEVVEVPDLSKKGPIVRQDMRDD